MKNVETGKQRIGQAIVLDPPLRHKSSSAEAELSSTSSCREMLIFPSCSYPETYRKKIDHEVAYISPALAFNLGLHVSCLRSLIKGGEETIASYFKDKVDDDEIQKGFENSSISVHLEPLCRLPRYASHFRVSFVKIPECGTLESLKGNSTVEAEDRQEMIDLALQNYFAVDRYLVKGDIFSIRIDWNCKSLICLACHRHSTSKTDGNIYFKVSLCFFFSFLFFFLLFLLYVHSKEYDFCCRLWLQNPQMSQFYGLTVPKLPLFLEAMFLRPFPQIC